MIFTSDFVYGGSSAMGMMAIQRKTVSTSAFTTYFRVTTAYPSSI